jgi:hypothetical protein
LKRVCIALVGGLVVAACGMGEMAGGLADIENPVSRRLNWFAYLDGADIRRECRAGSGDRARMVFNGRYVDQVRTYEVMDDGGAPVLRTHVFAPFQVNRPFGLDDVGDVAGGRSQAERIGEAGAQAVWAALADSGAFEPAPRGLWLDSEEFYWIAVGCRDGAVFFNAWRHPSPRFAALTFPDVLRRYETSDVAWPRLDAPPDVVRQVQIREGAVPHFRLEAGPEGITR